MHVFIVILFYSITRGLQWESSKPNCPTAQFLSPYITYRCLKNNFLSFSFDSVMCFSLTVFYDFLDGYNSRSWGSEKTRLKQTMVLLREKIKRKGKKPPPTFYIQPFFLEHILTYFLERSFFKWNLNVSYYRSQYNDPLHMQGCMFSLEEKEKAAVTLLLISLWNGNQHFHTQCFRFTTSFFHTFFYSHFKNQHKLLYSHIIISIDNHSRLFSYTSYIYLSKSRI